MQGKHELKKNPPVRNARHRARRKTPGKLVTAVVALALVFAATLSGTLAYLYTKSDTVQNSFVEGYADYFVVENFDGLEKSGVKVQNTGNVPAYIRVKLLPGWYDGEGKNIVAKTAWEPVFTPEAGWVKGNDGFWYYTSPVEPKQYTSVLISSITLGVDSVTLYKQSLEIIASCIQSVPDDAVLDAWDSGVSAVAGGALQVKTGG